VSRVARRALLGAAVAAGAYAAAAWFRLLPGREAAGDAYRKFADRRERAARLKAKLAQWAPENAAAPAGTVVFLGSSTIERGNFAALFPAARCLNRGLGGETAPELARRLGASLPRTRAAAYVVYAGSADLRFGGATPREAAARVADVLAALRPRTATWSGGELRNIPCALIEVLGEVGASGRRRDDVRELNARLAGTGRRRRLRVDPHEPPAARRRPRRPARGAVDGRRPPQRGGLPRARGAPRRRRRSRRAGARRDLARIPSRGRRFRDRPHRDRPHRDGPHRDRPHRDRSHPAGQLRRSLTGAQRSGRGTSLAHVRFARVDNVGPGWPARCERSLRIRGLRRLRDGPHRDRPHLAGQLRRSLTGAQRSGRGASLAHVRFARVDNVGPGWPARCERSLRIRGLRRLRDRPHPALGPPASAASGPPASCGSGTARILRANSGGH
jgi:hypothetical protein